MTTEGSAKPARRPRRRRLLLLVFAVVATLLALAVWRAWDSRRVAGDGEPPLLRAEPGPARERPEDPGGMEVPYRDVLALHELGVPRDEDGEIVVERLLPPPETPLPRPAAEEPAPPDASDASEADDEPGDAPPDVPTTLPGAPPATAEEESEEAPGAETEEPQEMAAAPEPESPPDDPAPPPPPEASAAPADEPPPAEAEPEDPIAALLARGGEFALQLGAFRTETDVELGWSRALDRAPELLGPLERFVARSDGFHRLRVGPFPDRQGAARLCEELRRVDVACFVVAL